MIDATHCRGWQPVVGQGQASLAFVIPPHTPREPKALRGAGYRGQLLTRDRAALSARASQLQCKSVTWFHAGGTVPWSSGSPQMALQSIIWAGACGCGRAGLSDPTNAVPPPACTCSMSRHLANVIPQGELAPTSPAALSLPTSTGIVM